MSSVQRMKGVSVASRGISDTLREATRAPKKVELDSPTSAAFFSL